MALLAAASAVSAQSSAPMPAPQVLGNPAGAIYVATLPPKAGSALSGSIIAVTAPSGPGVAFSVSFSGLPATGGPFIYHIHNKPVPANGNCTAAGAHLDPYMRGETPPCDATKPETCQVGDLSGKHGSISADSFSAQYLDPYLSLTPGTPAFFGNLSFVVHLANKTRIGCANFQMQTAPAPSGTPLGSYNGTATWPTGGLPPSPTYSAPSFTGAAAHPAGAAAAVLAAAAAALIL
ncbi:Cell surface superoxide dismutase [Cu-Zn] 4 [Pleosporales sp. CAS-2024a]